MKLNYYTYTVLFKSSGVTCNICIKDIIDLYCAYQKKQSVLEKTNSTTSRKLYFAKAGKFSSVYYLMAPTQLNQYRKLDRTQGTVEDLKKLIGKGSLEKVTYIHLDEKQPIIGIASSHGGASDEDVEFYLNNILNGFNATPEYKLEIKPLHSGIKRKK
ncbi:hypothetical protein [Vibrio taketomensis]|uniref:hypothetical protein n=1 Tax=Vibrio taketomensis TaxID=2572923 RepID=UPI0013899313|nr:hypothetical protein [Vibrio taketomensis]